jgi:hypothetical protein
MAPVRDFQTAVQSKKWDAAFAAFMRVENTELFKALHGLSEPLRDEFWGQDSLRTDPKYKYVLPRWEYAYVVVKYHTVPPTTPNYGDDMEKAARKYLRWRVRHQHTTLEQNLGYSMQAVNHVLTTVGLKGANWDIYRGKEHTYEKYSRLADAAKTKKQEKKYRALAMKYRDADDIALYFESRVEADLEIENLKKTQAVSRIDKYRIHVAKAKQRKVGNCGENSMMAFLFLYDMGVRPIERMGVDQDHAFVVIGRPSGNPNEVLEDPEAWGPHAVVCDPWAQGFRYNDISSGTYPGRQFLTKMTDLVGKFEIETNYRED